MSQQEATATGEGPSTAVKELSARSRRKTVFYEPDVPAEKEVFRVPKGSGTRLRDIPAIAAAMAKSRAEDPLLQDIHRILFKRTGVKRQRKKDIGDFSGFIFQRNEKESETEKLRERILHSKRLRKLVDFFCIPVKTGKEKMMDALVEFLMKPEDLSEEGEELPKETPKKRVTKKVTATRKRKSEEISSKPVTNSKRSSKRTAKGSKKSKEEPESPAKETEQQEITEADGQKATVEDTQETEEENKESPEHP